MSAPTSAAASSTILAGSLHMKVSAFKVRGFRAIGYL